MMYPADVLTLHAPHQTTKTKVTALKWQGFLILQPTNIYMQLSSKDQLHLITQNPEGSNFSTPFRTRVQ